MPSLRQSYTVSVPEEPPAAAFPFLKQEMRRKGSMSGSALVSTFVGLLINQAKVGDVHPPPASAYLRSTSTGLRRVTRASASVKPGFQS